MATFVDKRKVAMSIDGTKKVPAIDVINTIQHLQTILYQVGDYVYGNQLYTRSYPPQIVKDSCTLFITDIEMGSVTAEMQIGDDQVGITEDGTLGEMAICSTKELLEAISRTNVSKEDLYDIIKDPHRLNKLLREIYSMWPDEGAPRTISIGFAGEPMRELNPSYKKMVKELMHKPIDEYEKEVFGWVFDLRVDQQKKIMIDTPEGHINCLYNPEIEDVVIEYIGEFVNVRGTMKLHNGHYVMFIDNEDSIEKSSQYFLKEMKMGELAKKLAEAVPLELERDDGFYVASNDELGILASQKHMKDVIGETKEQLFILFKEYVLTDDKLATSGECLSRTLKSVVGDYRGFL